MQYTQVLRPCSRSQQGVVGLSLACKYKPTYNLAERDRVEWIHLLIVWVLAGYKYKQARKARRCDSYLQSETINHSLTH